MDFKERIKNRGIKKKKVAEDIGITPEHLSRVLNGKMVMTKEVEEKLVNYFK